VLAGDLPGEFVRLSRPSCHAVEPAWRGSGALSRRAPRGTSALWTDDATPTDPELHLGGL